MFWLMVVALWAAMLLSPVVILFLFLPAGRSCPRCGAETTPVRTRWMRPVWRVARMRWCLDCGWEGITRNGSWLRPLPKLEVVPDTTGDVEDDASWRPGAES